MRFEFDLMGDGCPGDRVLLDGVDISRHVKTLKVIAEAGHPLGVVIEFVNVTVGNPIDRATGRDIDDLDLIGGE